MPEGWGLKTPSSESQWASVHETHRTTANKEAVLTGCTCLAVAIPSGSEPGERAKSPFYQALLKRGLFAYFNSCFWLSRHLGLAVILSRDLGRLETSPPSSLQPAPRGPHLQTLYMQLHPSFYNCCLSDRSPDCVALIANRALFPNPTGLEQTTKQYLPGAPSTLYSVLRGSA